MVAALLYVVACIKGISTPHEYFRESAARHHLWICYLQCILKNLKRFKLVLYDIPVMYCYASCNEIEFHLEFAIPFTMSTWHILICGKCSLLWLILNKDVSMMVFLDVSLIVWLAGRRPLIHTLPCSSQLFLTSQQCNHIQWWWIQCCLMHTCRCLKCSSQTQPRSRPPHQK